MQVPSEDEVARLIMARLYRLTINAVPTLHHNLINAS